MQNGEGITDIFLWESRGTGRRRIERHTECSGMCAEQHIGHGHFVAQIRALAGMSRIFVSAEVVPGPAIEAALFDPADVVRNEIIAKTIAFIRRTPQGAGRGLDRESHTVANTGCEQFAASW